MTALEKFAICRALFHSQASFRDPQVIQQYRLSCGAVANAICPKFDENTAFRTLCGRDNWVNDNPFADD